MITSEGNFVIATPTKCGTTTLEEMARRHGGGRVSRGGVEVPSFRIMSWEQPRRQHRMAVPEGWEEVDRYLMVRNPYMRYMSMYEYLRAPHNYSKFGAREIQGREWGGWSRGRHGLKSAPMRFDQFLYFIAQCRTDYGEGRWVKRRGNLCDPRAYRSPWVWLDSLTDSLLALCAQGEWSWEDIGLLRLENVWEELSALKRAYGLDTLSVRPTIRANKTLTYPAEGAMAYWSWIKCSAHVFRMGRGGVVYVGPGAPGGAGCECAACAIGVAQEALTLGYVR